jgi:hypothetical protein
MRSLGLFLIVATLGSTVFAQTGPDEHRDHHPDSKASSAPAHPPIHGMQQNMKEMQALMEKIEETKDPSERARLLAQHAKAMREQMMSMTPMLCGEGMGQMGGAGMGRSGGGGAGKPGDAGHSMMSCLNMMQERMNMMTGMMEQMLRHEDARDAVRK